MEQLQQKVISLEKQVSKLESDNEGTSLKHQDNFAIKEQSYLKQIKELERENMELKKEKEYNLSPANQNHIKELEKQVLILQEQQPHWERQINEIIDWVGNEKEARNYLQQMAASMTEELIKLKNHQQNQQHLAQQQASIYPKSNAVNQNVSSVHAYVPKEIVNSNYTTWQERRSARVDKQELLQLQLELSNEIEDKQRIQSELAKAQRENALVNADLNELRIELQILKNQTKRAKQFSQPNESPALFTASSAVPRMPELHREKRSIDFERSDQMKQQLCIDNSDLGSNDNESESLKSDSSSQALQSSYSIEKQQHSFIVRTFVAPLKCFHCTSLMIGLVRQGLVCEVCGFACHVACATQGIQQCPCDDAHQRPVGIDPQRGIGTAYEGYVKIPKARGGVKKGWIRMFVVVCDFKLFLYDLSCNNDNSSSSGSYGSGSSSGLDGNPGGLNVTYFVSVTTLIDMRDEAFSVSGVLESDVIHACKRDIPCIFRVTTSMISGSREQKFTQSMLVDRESEKNKWIDALNELHRIIRRNKLSHRNV